MDWTAASALLQAAVGGYLIVHECVDLFPWNDVSRTTATEKLLACVFNVIPIGILAWGYAVRHQTLMNYGTGSYAVFLLLQLNQWWRPYLFGAGRRVRAEYQKRFSRTWKVLPAIQDHPVPDVQHLGLQVLTLLTLLATWQASA